ncbi:MAG: chromate efflux transporter [Pseudomonadota bacterium]
MRHPNAGADRVVTRRALPELAAVFLRLGVTAFGGPAAHVALMESELVRRRRWLTHERFLDLFGAANLIPGPSSSELALFIGYESAGLLGLLVAGLCFILPAALLAGGLAWVYVRFGALPQVTGLLYGVKPVIIALVLQALWGLTPRALKTRVLFAIALVAVVASAAGMSALLVLLGAGSLALLTRHGSSRLTTVPVVGGFWAAVAGSSAPSVTKAGVFAVFLKMGAVVFGSGYVLLAFLREDLVHRLHWLSERKLLDAVAVGQVTPGPVFTTATFIGYVLAGPAGACLATVGIFLPGFIFVAFSRPLLGLLRRSPTTAAFLDGVNAAALALMAVVSAQLARAALIDTLTVAIALIAGLLLIKYKTNSAWLILGSALLGVLRVALN